MTLGCVAILKIMLLISCLYRLLEINGTDVATKSFRETNKLLLHHHQAGTTMKIVVARPLDSLRHEESGLSQPDEGTQRRDSAERYQKLNASLKAKLDFQSAEVDHWKQECERYDSNLNSVTVTLFGNRV